MLLIQQRLQPRLAVLRPLLAAHTSRHLITTGRFGVSLSLLVRSCSRRPLLDVRGKCRSLLPPRRRSLELQSRPSTASSAGHDLRDAASQGCWWCLLSLPPPALCRAHPIRPLDLEDITTPTRCQNMSTAAADALSLRVRHGHVVFHKQVVAPAHEESGRLWRGLREQMRRVAQEVHVGREFLEQHLGFAHTVQKIESSGKVF